MTKTPASILVVDDNETNRILLHDLIVSCGYEPVLAQNGLSALAQIHRHPPDLVLLDILMPELDGHEVLTRLKESGVLRSLPVIVVSSVDDMESIVRCIEAGADDYLIKPFSHALLRARIASSLEKKRLRDQEAAFRQQIEHYSLNLEKTVREQVLRITASELERANLSRYLSPSIVDAVLTSEREMHLGGSVTRATVLFADIRGYTRLSQQLGAAEIMAMLNEHFTSLSEIVFECEGTLDKFIGDSVMAVFGAPFSTGRDEYNALNAALKIQRKLCSAAERRRREGKPPIQVGIGINTGDLVCGNLGSPQKMDFTVIGDTVNISSRLQGIAKGGEIIVGEATFAAIKDDFHFEEIGEIELKNSMRPVRCYRVLVD